MKYKKLTGVVLKKQNYKEADQIVTLWTREAGKVRVMARGLRHGKSKLSYSMQDLSLVEFETAGSKSLPSLISAKAIKNFSKLRDELYRTVAAFYAAELMLKMTADEQSNEEAYGLLLEYLAHLNSGEMRQSIFCIVDSFSLKLVRTLGFSMDYAQGTFNLPPELEEAVTLLSECSYQELPEISEATAKQSHAVVRNFLEFILERSLKSEQLLVAI